jgi:Golgi apparatus protein 1
LLQCIGDYQRYCKDVEPGNMQAQECLEDNIDDADFSAECKEELENLIAKVCGSGSFWGAYQEATAASWLRGGASWMQWGRAEVRHTSFDVASWLWLLVQRAVDFRLDTALRDACESDLKNTCGVSLEDMDSDEKIKKKGLDCLQQYREELKSDKCRCITVWR